MRVKGDTVSIKRKIKTRFIEAGPLRFFIGTVLIFGLIFLFATPPFETPDEPAHFMRSYQVSGGNFVVDTIGTTAGGYLPSSINQTINLTTRNPDIMFHPEGKYSLAKTRRAFSIKLNPSRKELYDFGATADYSPVSYIPQSLMILLGRIFKAPPIILMYLGRLGNLIAWIILMGASIYLLPRRRWLLVFIGLLPMALFEAVSMSADVMAVGVLTLFVALVLKLREKTTLITRREFIFLLTVGTAMALDKQIMFIFLPIILLIPGKVMARQPNSRLLRQAALIIVPLLLFGVWMFVVRGINTVGAAANAQNPHMQLGYIHQHPLSYIEVLARTYFLSPYFDLTTRSFIGNFGWLDTPLPELVVAFGYVAMAFIYMAGHENMKDSLTKANRWLIIAIGTLYILAVSTALYLYFDPVGLKSVWGIQGRYLLPLAVLAVPLFLRPKLVTSRTTYHWIAKLSPLFLLIYSVVIIIFRYYINYS